LIEEGTVGMAEEGMRWQLLECSVAVEDGCAYVRPVGELDLASAPVLDGRLREALSHEPRALEIDLSGLTFMDSSGVHLLLQWHTTTAESGIEFSLSGASVLLQRLFALTGADEVLPLRPGRQEGEQ
jgi:anti-sigma B factor antagonist